MIYDISTDTYYLGVGMLVNCTFKTVFAGMFEGMTIWTLLSKTTAISVPMIVDELKLKM
jgi:hypothetical protein